MLSITAINIQMRCLQDAYRLFLSKCFGWVWKVGKGRVCEHLRSVATKPKYFYFLMKLIWN